jgi:hypothetical protein
MKKTIFVLICIVTLSCNQSQKNVKEKQSETIVNGGLEKDTLKSQILYHGDCSYTLSETHGWIANSEPSQNSDDIKNLVMYEPDSSIKNIAPMGISSNVIFKENYIDSTFNGFLKNEMRTALERGEKVLKDKPILTKDNKDASIIKYLIENKGEYFAIAYINEPKYIIMIIYSCKDFNDYMNNYNSFKEIVKSYKYLGMVVIDETKKMN